MVSSAASPTTDSARRLRILAILNGSVRGYSGGDLHTIGVLNEWARDHDVELFLPPGSSLDVAGLLSPRVRLLGSQRTHDIPSRPRYLWWVLARTLVAMWYVAARRGRWDVAIASSHFVFDALPALLAGDSAGRGVYWWHHATAPSGRPRWTHNLVRFTEASLVRLVARSRVRVLTGNSQTSNWLQGHGVSVNAITLTRNGPSFPSTEIPTDQVFANEPRLKRLAGTRFVLFCARLTNLKGAADLPAICRHVLEVRKDASIVICGTESPEGAAVHHELATFERTGAVAFLGFVSEPVKQWLFQHAHVLIAPSYEEGWGATVIDGVVSGCWVVTYDLPAVRESCSDGPIFIPVGDVANFSRAVSDRLGKPRPSQQQTDDSSSWERIAQTDLQAITQDRLPLWKAH